MNSQNFNFDVLVVDDVISAAESYAKLIESTQGFKTTFTSDPDEALRIVQYNNIKVLVLDQKMPLPGTELLKKLRPYTAARALMLTGEADKEDLGMAINLNFHQYVKKSEVTKLPSVVLEQYSIYYEELKTKLKCCDKKFLGWKFKGLDILVYFQIDDILIDSSYIEENREVYFQIYSGQEKEIKTEFHLAQEMIIESNSEFNINNGLKGSSEALIGTFESSIRKILKVSKRFTRQRSQQKSIKYHLSTDDEKLITHRIIEYSPVYEIHKLVLCSKGMKSKKVENMIVIVKKFTGKYNYYQVDTLKDGSKQIVDIGMHGTDYFE